MSRVYTPGGLARDPFYFWHVSGHLGVVLVSIPKNACTVQKRWLLGVEGIDAAADPHETAFRRLSLLNQPPDRAREALERYPVVAFLREPFDRLVSAFRDKFLGRFLNFPAVSAIEGAAAARGVPLRRDRTIGFPAMGAGALLAACGAVDYDRGLTFREFVEYVASAPDLELDPHWRPQSWFLGPTRAKSAAPARVTLAPMDLVSEVLGRLGQSRGIAGPPAPHEPAPSPPAADLSRIPSGELRRRRQQPTARELLTPELADLLTRRFAMDVGLWRLAAAERDAPAGPVPGPAATIAA